jgi:hypothetical protein
MHLWKVWLKGTRKPETFLAAMNPKTEHGELTFRDTNGEIVKRYFVDEIRDYHAEPDEYDPKDAMRFNEREQDEP